MWINFRRSSSSLAARLLEDGLIEECSIRPDPAEDDERRRYYSLTELGRKVAAAETERMRALVLFADHKELDDSPQEA